LILFITCCCCLPVFLPSFLMSFCSPFSISRSVCGPTYCFTTKALSRRAASRLIHALRNTSNICVCVSSNNVTFEKYGLLNEMFYERL
jgi:hypothetical protein